MTPLDPTTLLRLRTPAARAVLAAFLVLHLLLVIGTIDEVRQPWVAFLAYAIVGVAAVVVCSGSTHPLPAARTGLVLLLCAVASASVWNLPVSGPATFSSWVWGAVTYVLFFVALRGRIAAAWCGMALMCGITIAWCLAVGRPLADAPSLLVRHVAFLAVSTALALLIGSAVRRLRSMEQLAVSRTVAEAASHAALDEQRMRLERLRMLVTPAIERLASDAPLSAAERASVATLEATLRDELRGRQLASPLVAEAVAAARARGVDVTLLDDRGDDLDESQRDAVEQALLAQLADAQGPITARLLPAGRDELLTIVRVEGERRRRVTVEQPRAEITAERIVAGR